jgi:hypothetical protein
LTQTKFTALQQHRSTHTDPETWYLLSSAEEYNHPYLKSIQHIQFLMYERYRNPPQPRGFLLQVYTAQRYLECEGTDRTAQQLPKRK